MCFSEHPQLPNYPINYIKWNASPL